MTSVLKNYINEMNPNKKEKDKIELSGEDTREGLDLCIVRQNA